MQGRRTPTVWSAVFFFQLYNKGGKREDQGAKGGVGDAVDKVKGEPCHDPGQDLLPGVKPEDQCLCGGVQHPKEKAVQGGHRRIEDRRQPPRQPPWQDKKAEKQGKKDFCRGKLQRKRAYFAHRGIQDIL